MEPQRARLIAAALLGAAALCGCGGGTAATTTIAPEPQGIEPNKGSPGANDASGGKIDVDIRDGRFAPHVMRVGVGHIVVFTNDDDVPHTVRAVGRGLPRSGAIPPGGRFEYTPLTPARIAYRCVLHPGMTGVLVVSR